MLKCGVEERSTRVIHLIAYDGKKVPILIGGHRGGHDCVGVEESLAVDDTAISPPRMGTRFHPSTGQT